MKGRVCASSPGDSHQTRGLGATGQGLTWRAGTRTQFTRYGLLVSSRDTKVRSWCWLLILSLSSERVRSSGPPRAIQ